MTKIADTYLDCDPWQIIEEGFHREHNLVSESIFSLGNEYMGIRGYAEEGTSAESLRGSYFNGIYEEADLGKSYKGIVTETHFMVNAVDYMYTQIRSGNETLDTACADIRNFKRILDMRQGYLQRSFDWHTQAGDIIHFEFTRFLVMENSFPQKIGAAHQKISFLVISGKPVIKIIIGNNFNVCHGWDKKNYWNMEKINYFNQGAAIQASVIRTKQQIFSGFTWRATGIESYSINEKEKCAAYEIIFANHVKEGWIEKNIVNYAVKEHDACIDTVWEYGMTVLGKNLTAFDSALDKQRAYWAAFWKNADIRIEGDPLNQQGIRFCIFQMNQTYNGYNPSNNIGAKGLSGEAYNGHTFWDTETYCLPFYLFSNPKAARNLLEYRYAALNAARDRAKMLDCRGACYPVATLNGQECCNLWQHASLQFQSSTGVAFGIAHYVRVSGDTEFLYSHGAEMLVEISRFLESRGSWNNDKTGFGFYAVMGPDEFHMMVNHNCYTNFMAKKTFEYTEQILQEMEKNVPLLFKALCGKTGLSDAERKNLVYCSQNMIILYDDTTKLFEQHEGYFTLPRIAIADIPVTDFPLYHNWSYDRIYRSSMIKQPDVLMFLFLHNQEFSREVKLNNYEYYEPNTIHESSLSPSIHSILACELGKYADASRFFSFATRLDLDNYNRNTSEGLHTTSIAAAWMNIVYGFGGLRSDGNELVLNPVLPGQWTEYEFRFLYKTVHITVNVNAQELTLSTQDTVHEAIPLIIYGKRYQFDNIGIRIKK